MEDVPEFRYLKLELHRQQVGGGVWGEDDFPYAGPVVEELGPDYKAVRRFALEDRKAIFYSNQHYIYASSAGHWVHSRSEAASRQVCRVVGIDNVTVNYAAASSPYITYIEMIARPASQIPTSVCISSYRLQLLPLSKRPWSEGFTLKPIWGCTTNTNPEMSNKRSTGLCISPLQSSAIPKLFLSGSMSAAEASLSNVMTPYSLKLLMWIIGNGLIDPATNPRAVYLYGLGGNGKTTTINTIISNLRGTVHPLGRDYVGTSGAIMTHEDLVAAISSRFITYGDVVLTKAGINSSFWKTVTGGDTVSVRGGFATLNCTGIFASNHIWYPGSQTLKPWFTRRTVAILMTSPQPGSQLPPGSFDDFDISRFASNCIVTRMSSEQIPMDVGTALLTVFGRRVCVATRGIVFTDMRLTDMGAVAATWAVSIAGTIDYDLLVELIEAMSPELIASSRGVKSIRGIMSVIPPAGIGMN